jgi:hypothetical protein
MLSRSRSFIVASLAAATVAVVPAVVHATDVPAPNTPAGKCTDTSRPKSAYTSKAARTAKRTHVLRGSARDTGCGVDRVEISVARRVAKGCRYLHTASRVSSHTTSCGKASMWLPVRGTTKWTFRLPKKLARGKYVIRTRATDFAANVERVRSRALNIR